MKKNIIIFCVLAFLILSFSIQDRLHIGNTYINDSTSITATITPGLVVNGRFSTKKSASTVAVSSGTLTLGTDGNVFEVSTSTTLNNITVTNWQTGSVILLYFKASMTITNSAGGSGQIINPGGNISAAVDDCYEFVLNGTNWIRVK